MRDRALGTAALLLAGLAAAGCGGERRFDAESVVAELNAAGAGLELGGTLESSEAGTEVRVLRLAGEAEPASEPGGDEHGHGGAGAVVILDDVEAATTEFARCDRAISFVCFRAANTVLRFADLGPEEQARIVAAVRSLESDG